MKNILFLLLGHGLFLSYVGMRITQEQLNRSPFIFSWLSIHLLQPEAIKTIIKKTFVDRVMSSTIKDNCKLDDYQLDAVAQYRFQQMSVHPRTLILAI